MSTITLSEVELQAIQGGDLADTYAANAQAGLQGFGGAVNAYEQTGSPVYAIAAAGYAGWTTGSAIGFWAVTAWNYF